MDRLLWMFFGCSVVLILAGGMIGWVAAASRARSRLMKVLKGYGLGFGGIDWDRCDSSGYFKSNETSRNKRTGRWESVPSDCTPEHPCRLHAIKQVLMDAADLPAWRPKA